jgi:hypothetical protein
MACIRDPLKRGSGAKAFDRSYSKLEPVLTGLVELGTGICASPKCSPRLISKLQVIADFASSVGSTNNVIRRELSRNTFKTVTIHCGKGHAALFVALVDSWLQACEEHVRSLLQEDEIDSFEKALEQLRPIVKDLLYNIYMDETPRNHISKDSYFEKNPEKVSDHLLQIFTSLKLL